MKKTKLLFSVLIILISTFRGMSQWESLPNTGIPNDTGGNAQCIAAGDGKLFLGMNGTGVFYSDDNGTTWTDANIGVEPGKVYSILVEDTMAYLAVNRQGVYRSSTRNIQWEEITGGSSLPNKDFTSLAIMNDTLYMGTLGDFIYYTSLEFVGWNKYSSNIDANVTSLIVDPLAGRLIAGTRDDNNLSVYEAGAWRKINYPIGSDVRSLAVYDSHIFIGADNGFYFAHRDSITETTYHAELQTNGISQDKILALETDGTTIYASLFGYVGAGPGIYAATIDTENQMSFTNYNVGFRIPRSIIRGLAFNGTVLWSALDSSGPYYFNEGTSTWVFSADGIDKETVIKQVIEHNSKLYAITTIGVYESASGNGGDWQLYSLESKIVDDFLFASSGSEYAVAYGILHKDGNIVEYDTGDDYPLNDQLTGLNSLFEYQDTNTGTDYIFVGSWQAGFDGYAGVYRTSDDGATWTRYGTVTDVENGDGLHENNRILATSWSASSDGTIYTTGKHITQLTMDLGDNYTWRKGNNNMPAWGTTSNTVVRTYQDEEYLFMGMEDYWYVGRSLVGENVATVWEKADGTNTNKAPKRPLLTNYSDSLLFASALAGNSVKKTENNGDEWFVFQTGLENANHLSKISVGENYVYIGGGNKDVYRYDMITSPTWTEAPSMYQVDYSSASMFVNSSRPGRVYYIAMPADSLQPDMHNIMEGLSAGGFEGNIFGNQKVLANVEDTVFISGLELETDYVIYTFLRDEVTLFSPIESVTFTTLAGSQITFNVTETNNPVPVTGATVSFNETTIVTDASGNAVFSDVIPAEDLPYTVEKTGFISAEGLLTVTDNEAVNVSITPLYNLEFIVEDANGALSGASVVIGEEEILTAPDGSALFTPLEGNIDYDYTIQKDGYYSQSGTITLDETQTVNITLVLEPVCPEPVELATGDITDISASLSWNTSEGNTDILHFLVYYKESLAETWTEVQTGASPYALAALASGVEYKWTVSSVCSEGGENWGIVPAMDTLTFRTISNNDCQDFPVQNAETTSVWATSAQVSWDDLSGVSGFDVWYRKVGLTIWEEAFTTSNMLRLTGLTPEQTYEWQVRSVCEVSETVSEWTTPIQFITLEESTPGDGGGSNPIAQFYNGPEGYPTWTDRIQWGNQIDMNAYTNGANDFERFENARDELYAQGGGVLYYPEGVYNFSDAPLEDPNGRGLMLKKGVVILGETPDGDADGSDGTMELKTKFVFPFIAKGGGEVPAPWNIIGMMPDGEELKDVDDVGIAWVHIEGATVYWGFQMDMGATYETSDAWLTGQLKESWYGRVPDGTYPMDIFLGQAEKFASDYDGAGSGRFVFGCYFENSVMLNDVYDRGFGPTGFSTFQYGGKIMVYGSHAFIANNVISKPTKSFLYEQMTSEGLKTIIFDYGYTTGIDINKNNTNVSGNRLSAASGYFEPGVVVQDNWIYNHGFKTIDGAGNWVTMKNNYGARDILTPGQEIYGLETGWTLTGDGYKTHADIGSSDAFQNRGYDLAGSNMWIDGNYYENLGTAYPSNDGEGILAQRHGGTDIHSWSMTNNFDGPVGHRVGYIGGYDVHNHGVMIAWNNIEGTVGHIKPESNDLVDASFVDNIASGVNTAVGGESDYIIDCPAGALTPPSAVTATLDAETYSIVIEWTDETDEEIGYRIERRLAGTDAWTTIAFRPRQSFAHPNNPAKWIDFMVPIGQEFEYRVAAVNCDNDDSGASEPISACFPVKVATPEFSLNEGIYYSQQIVTINTDTQDAEIRYTLDGTDPDETSELYTGQIIITETVILKAIAFKGCNYPSNIASVTYIIQPDNVNNIPTIEGVKLYPNPGDRAITLEIDNNLSGTLEISVVDYAGRVVIRKEFAKETGTLTQPIDIDHLEQGAYFIRMSLGDKILVEKLIKL